MSEPTIRDYVQHLPSCASLPCSGHSDGTCCTVECPRGGEPCDCGLDRLLAALAAPPDQLDGQARYEMVQEVMLERRGIRGEPCPACVGWGVRTYSSTATWRGGIGGQAMTDDVCDRCWGSGDADRPWPSRRAAPPDRQEQPVIQKWACSLPLRMQSTMLLSLRGPDGCSKHNTAKRLLRQLRSAVLVPAFPGRPDSFMGDQRGYCEWAVAEAFLDDHDAYPHHWLMHFVHAAEIVGQFHPDDVVRGFWWRLYLALCDSFHMTNENIERLSDRLADPPSEAAPVPQGERASEREK